jgi:glycosyltransferase involved in cell wall biosynthesis
MKVGIFHPQINWCGGAEFVAIEIIKTLKENGFQVVLLTNEKLNQKKIRNIYGEDLSVDSQIVFPFYFFSPTDTHNVYTEILRSLILKSKSDIVIDTKTNTIIPNIDITYIHYPFLRSLPLNIKNRIFYLQHRIYARQTRMRARNREQKIVLCNSKYTAEAIRETFGVNPYVLYPPVKLPIFHQKDIKRERENSVITISRISKEKRLTQVPHIAKLTKAITFTIIGLLDSREEYFLILKTINNLEVSDRVKVLVNVPRETLNNILLDSKIYLHTCVGEHFGISIIEGMSGGCIPIVPNSGGPKEFVPEELRYDGIEEAAEKIEKSIHSWSPQYVQESINIAEKFSEKEFSRKFLEIFQSYIDNKLNRNKVLL